MQLKPNASLDFVNLSVEKKPAFGNGVTSSLTTYAVDFPALPITIVELQNINSVLNDAITDAQTGNHVARAGLITAEKEWDTAFRATGKYVGNVANGDMVIIEKGGYKPTKSETTSPQIPDAVKNFKAEAENASGTITASCDAADGVRVIYI
jgi:hypothetical protein